MSCCFEGKCILRSNVFWGQIYFEGKSILKSQPALADSNFGTCASNESLRYRKRRMRHTEALFFHGWWSQGTDIQKRINYCFVVWLVGLSVGHFWGRWGWQKLLLVGVISKKENFVFTVKTTQSNQLIFILSSGSPQPHVSKFWGIKKNEEIF